MNRSWSSRTTRRCARPSSTRCAPPASPRSAAGEANEALRLLASEEIALVISDVQMPGPNGYELLSSIKRLRPHLPVVLMTAYGTVAQAVAAMREGATDYIVKPFDAQALIDMARRQLAARVMPNELIAVDPESKRTVSLARKIAASDATVLITGESGTGKEVYRALHSRQFGARRPALRRDQLRGDSGKHARGDAVRLREGRLHRRPCRPRRQIRAGTGRYAAAR